MKKREKHRVTRRHARRISEAARADISNRRFMKRVPLTTLRRISRKATIARVDAPGYYYYYYYYYYLLRTPPD